MRCHFAGCRIANHRCRSLAKEVESLSTLLGSSTHQCETRVKENAAESSSATAMVHYIGSHTWLCLPVEETAS